MANHTVDPYCAEDRTIDASGIDRVRLPMTCSSLILTMGNDGAGYDLSLNYDETFGTGTELLREKHFVANQVVTITNYKVRSIMVRGTEGATWGYLGFVSPRTGLSINVEG